MTATLLMERTLRIATATALALTLGGCVSLLPKAKPADLYRFGGEQTGRVIQTAVKARGVSLGAIEFPREATTDGILTVEGSQTSYIAGSRWIAPAPVLFRQALSRTVDTAAPSINLLHQGEMGKVAGILDLDVVRFEAHYDNPKGAPTIWVTMQARLAANNGAPIAAQTFNASVPASENGARAIVVAYNQAIDQTLDGLAHWLDQNTPAVAPLRSTSTTASTTSTPTTTRQP